MSQGQQGKSGGSADQRKPAAAKPGAGATRASSANLPAISADVKPSELTSDTSMLTKHQKSQLGSEFADSSAERRRNSLLATSIPAVGAKNPFADDEPTSFATRYDGKEVPAQLQNRDLWKAVQAPLQSREGKRAREVYEMVVKQFGVLVNPRYADDAPGKIRGHIFVWDVSRAMNCEIPHFVGAKELSLAQTCDWLRHEGPMRGWKRVSDADIVEAANSGRLVVALPRELKNKQIAIIQPQEPADDGAPRLTGICLRRATDAHPRDMFGARPMDCYYHD